MSAFFLFLFLALALRDPCLHNFLDECSWHRFIQTKVNCSLGGREVLEFVLESFDNRGSRKQTAVLRKCGEPHQNLLVLEGRNPIADRLGGLVRDSGPNCGANLAEVAACRFRDTSEIVINALGSNLW